MYVGDSVKELGQGTMSLAIEASNVGPSCVEFSDEVL